MTKEESFKLILPCAHAFLDGVFTKMKLKTPKLSFLFIVRSDLQFVPINLSVQVDIYGLKLIQIKTERHKAHY